MQRKGQTKVPYNNVKAGRAEETLISMIIKEPTLLSELTMLNENMFTVPLFSKIFEQFRKRYFEGLEISVSVLTDLSPDEMSHLVGVVQGDGNPVTETSLHDCIKVIQEGNQRINTDSNEAMLAYQKKLKESKGVKA